MAQRIYAVQSSTINGVSAVPVQVEVVISNGLPGFSIVGMADGAIHESRERVKAALRSAGFQMPVEKIVVNLAPGSLRKHGSGFDLPIALGILCASGQINPEELKKYLVVGELSLDGNVSSVQGLLSHQRCAKELGLSLLTGQTEEGIITIDGVDAYSIKSLGRIRTFAFEELRPKLFSAEADYIDLAEIGGHEFAKRALQIAVAGNHGLLMIGPPGSGKTMLARAIPGIMPPLTQEQIEETALIYSVAGKPIGSIMNGTRPFRDPHHSSTPAGLLGGGSPLRPGEVSLAHNGVLFLDEFPEFKPSTLQQLRQIVEEKEVHLTRADGSYDLPANFMLVAAMNPCPCGYYGDPNHSCTCSVAQVNSYQNKIGGPLFDRIDIHIDVWPSSLSSVLEEQNQKTSVQIRNEVIEAKKFAKHCSFDKEPVKENSSLPSVKESHSAKNTIKKALIKTNLDEDAYTFFEALGVRKDISMRSLLKILLLSRTVANLALSNKVKREHIAEAFMYRSRGGVG